MEFLLDECDVANTDAATNLYDIFGNLDRDNNHFTFTSTSSFPSPPEPIATLENSQESTQHHQPPFNFNFSLGQDEVNNSPNQVDFSSVVFIQPPSNAISTHPTADNDSDSGICSSVSCDDSPTSNTSHQVFSSAPSSVIDLDNEQDLVDQLISSNDLDLSQFTVDQQLLGEQSDNASTEQLLNSIEHMLKSMDTPVISDNQQQSKTSKKNLGQVKKEPNDTEYNNNFKKISPKILPKPIQGNVVEVKAPIIIQPVQLTGGSRGNTILIENFSSLNAANILSGVGESVSRSPQAKKLKSNNQEMSMVNSSSPMIASLPVAAFASNSGGSSTNIGLSQSFDLDPSLIKKQSRMIKNRESACLSRKRKKEYVTTLEESLKEIKNENESLKQDNQKLREKVLVLETENKLLKEQQQQQQQIAHYQQQNSVRVIELNRPKPGLTTLKTVPINNAGSLKRPFIMMAVFFVFGLNILQFINVDTINNSNVAKVSRSLMLQEGRGIDYSPAQLAEAMVASSHENGLVDITVKSRHLLSDYDYPEEEQVKKPSDVNDVNLTRKGNDSSMELVFINGTWQMIDLNVCYKLLSLNDSGNKTFYNHTHFNKINNELNGWFESHVKLLKNNNFKSNDQENFASALWREFIKEKQKKYRPLPSKPERTVPSRRLRSAGSHNRLQEQKTVKDYPVSLYNTQSRLYDNFAKKVRTRDDTFYYVSFRKDHIIFPAINQNKTQRPKVSLIVPALLATGSNSSSDSGQKLVHFIQIDCEVADTRLFSLKPDELPLDYLKILNQDVLTDFERQQGEQTSYEYD